MLTKLIKSKSRADVPGWVLVVLMTTALVTGIWSIAAPKLTTILAQFLRCNGRYQVIAQVFTSKISWIS